MDLFVQLRLQKPNLIILLHHTPKFGIPVEMVQFLLKLFLNQIILAVYHNFHWVLIATKLLTAKLHSLNVNTLASAKIRGFSGKKRVNACGFAWEFLRSGMLYRPGTSLKTRSKSSSLHSKNFFCWGVWVFCEWGHKWRTFRPPWPTLPGPGRQPLGGSISLKYLLETRLQSESSDSLVDLLGFRV